jgi:outer membrane protein TolC
VNFLSAHFVRRRRRPALHLLLGFVLLSPALQAEPPPLSLFDAVHLAERQAPQIRARSAAIVAAEAAIGPAGQLPDPELILGLENLPVTGGDRLSLTDDFMTMRKLGLMQSFPRREKRLLRAERAESEAERERALLINERLGVHEAVARAWIAVAIAEQRARLLEELRATADAQLAAATAALTSGRGSAADGINARSAVVALQDRILAAQAEVDAARTDLERWLPEIGERKLAPPPDWFDLGVEADSLAGKIGHHRELLVFDAAEHAAATDVALARAEKRPDWSLELSYAQRGPQFSNMLSVQFRVGLPLFAGKRQEPTIAAKQALLEGIEAEREAALRMHGADLARTLVTWRSSAERLRRYQRDLLPLAEERAAVALAAYRGGNGDLGSVLVTLEAAIEQRLAYVDLLNTLAQAWATLHFAFPQEG